jgi:hypothetical protein
MSATNSAESKVNWGIKLHKRERVIKAVSNLVFARGD